MKKLFFRGVFLLILISPAALLTACFGGGGDEGSMQVEGAADKSGVEGTSVSGAVPDIEKAAREAGLTSTLVINLSLSDGVDPPVAGSAAYVLSPDAPSWSISGDDEPVVIKSGV